MGFAVDGTDVFRARFEGAVAADDLERTVRDVCRR